MNIYCEMLLDRIRIKIDGEENAFQVTPGFYAHRMAVMTGISTRIRGYVLYHQSDMNFLERIIHRIAKNKVFILVNQDVQQSVTLRQVHEFAARFLNGGNMYIIPKPTTFDSTDLENIETIRTEYIKENQNRDTTISKLRTITRTANPAFK